MNDSHYSSHIVVTESEIAFRGNTETAEDRAWSRNTNDFASLPGHVFTVTQIAKRLLVNY